MPCRCCEIAKREANDRAHKITSNVGVRAGGGEVNRAREIAIWVPPDFGRGQKMNQTERGRERGRARGVGGR